MRKWNTVLKIFINMSVTCFGTDMLGSLKGFLPAITKSLCIAEKKQDCSGSQEGNFEPGDGVDRRHGFYDVVMHTLGLLINLTENDKINCSRVSELEVPATLEIDSNNINFLEYLVQVFVRHICSSMQTVITITSTM